MGTTFSGWFGRRSSRPFFDELLRITIADCKQNAPGLISCSWKGQPFTVRKTIVSIGCMAAPRLICSFCGKGCRVVYLRGMACCHKCTGARYRTQSESPSRRALRRAKKVFRARKLEPGRPAWKPKWQRWATYDRLEAAADAALPIIERGENAFFDALEAKPDTPKEKS